MESMMNAWYVRLAAMFWDKIQEFVRFLRIAWFRMELSYVLCVQMGLL